MVKGHVQDMRLRFGLLIEAQADEEMPEQMLACAYVSCLSSAACPLVPEQVLREVPRLARCACLACLLAHACANEIRMQTKCGVGAQGGGQGDGLRRR